jgi:hypothetical protein
MSHEIRPVCRSCKSYRPGHQVHWIQAKKSSEEGQPVIYVSVVVHDNGQIDIEGHDLSLVMWNHDPARLRSASGYRARVVWKPRYHVLNVSGYVFSMADLAEQTACLQKVAQPPELDTTVDRVLWEARTYGGYTVPVSSLRPGDEVEIAEALRLTERKGDTWEVIVKNPDALQQRRARDRKDQRSDQKSDSANHVC